MDVEHEVELQVKLDLYLDEADLETIRKTRAEHKVDDKNRFSKIQLKVKTDIDGDVEVIDRFLIIFGDDEEGKDLNVRVSL